MAVSTADAAPPAKPLADKVLVLGHRGASALRPEHTLASYGQAIEDGADFVEPDLVMTRDGVLVARHENEISGTTDVAKHPEFAVRKTTKTIDGQPVTGWFTEDFTLAEFKTLRAHERLPELRPGNAKFDGQFAVPTFDEIIAFVAAESKKRGRVIGIYPEIKHSTYFKGIGLPMEDAVLATIRRHAYTAKTAPLFIQSFEIANLKTLRGKLGDLPNVKLIQLLGEAKEQPYDVVAAKQSLPYSQMMQPQGLAEIAKYADAIGPNKLSVIPRTADGKLGAPTALVADAHVAKLLVHPYTFRPENYFLPSDLRAPGTPATHNEAGAIAEIRAYLDAGIDGFFTDDPALGRKAVER
ncbi:MAG: glycerophosphodiester phosphodiesterase [Proteobacteria bacterium]|uniref:glycerophosphodiester phosphodiesterase n=1 Tax=Rudaea sp. TaxID=2136325 RepID=UPI00321FC424|nr:glycerophosphodiester phosphodiesterase [Pseudomonadota bacterium]